MRWSKIQSYEFSLSSYSTAIILFYFRHSKRWIFVVIISYELVCHLWWLFFQRIQYHRYLFHLKRFHFIIVCFVQTITKLSLSFNEIHDEGAEIIGDILKKNIVMQIFFQWIILLIGPCCVIQALKILDIGANDIGIKGTEYLANALKENMVTNFFCIYSI